MANVIKPRPPTAPIPRPKRRVLLTMTPEALKLAMFKWYAMGFGDTGRGFNGDTIPPTNKALRSLLAVRFDRAYKMREDL